MVFFENCYTDSSWIVSQRNRLYFWNKHGLSLEIAFTLRSRILVHKLCTINTIETRYSSGGTTWVEVTNETSSSMCGYQRKQFRKLADFFDKFSSGDSFSDQARTFLLWLADQTEGVDQRLLDQQIQKRQDEKKARVSLLQRSHGRLAVPETRPQRRILFSLQTETYFWLWKVSEEEKTRKQIGASIGSRCSYIDYHSFSEGQSYRNREKTPRVSSSDLSQVPKRLYFKTSSGETSNRADQARTPEAFR